MIRTVVSIVLFVLLIVGCVWIYRIVTHDQVPGGGEVLVKSNTEHDQMESGTTYIGDKPIEAHPTPSRSDTPGTINTEPVADYGHAASNSVETTQYGASDQPKNGFDNNPAKASFPEKKFDQNFGGQNFGGQTYGGGNDTLPPNSPNGMAFTGSGAFQWYRQGDLTWRVDSKSGYSCVDYATMEEWSKPIVYSHGCARSGEWHRHHARG